MENNNRYSCMVLTKILGPFSIPFLGFLRRLALNSALLSRYRLEPVDPFTIFHLAFVQGEPWLKPGKNKKNKKRLSKRK